MDAKEEATLLEMCDSNTKRSRSAILEVIEREMPHLVTAVMVNLQRRGIQGDLDRMAMDIVQDVVVNLVLRTKDGSLLDIDSIESYLYGAVRRRTRCYLRDQARERDKLRDSGGFLEKTDRILVEAGLSPSETRELEEAVYDCLQRLKGKQQA